MFEIFVIVMGVFMSLGYYPQAYKIYKNKSAKDVSIQTFVVFSLGTTTWLVYGIYAMDIIIVTGFALGVIGSWLVLGLSLFYRNKEKD